MLHSQIKDEILMRLGLDPREVLLAQGTLRPDLIESASSIASKHADAIKTHHNDTELVRILREEGRVIEPLRDFHKDEVRQLGRDLGLPENIVERHPFPGALNGFCSKCTHCLEYIFRPRSCHSHIMCARAILLRQFRTNAYQITHNRSARALL